MISEEYRDEIIRFHKTIESWGSRGFNWAYLVAGIAQIEMCRTILDFGCGKGSLSTTLRLVGYNVFEYDPGIPGKSHLPFPADLVVSTDVLEHVEPDFIDATIDTLAKLTRKRLFVVISTRPASKILPSGRNAHLIIESADWWRDKFLNRGFVIRRVWPSHAQEWIALMNATEK